MNVPSYDFNYGEPGHFIEIYLPKKRKYLRVLQRTLDGGFDLDRVRKHLINHAPEIRTFLRRHQEYQSFEIGQVSRLSPSYHGYSLYELDGAFRQGTKIWKEKTQVVRLMFLPPKTLFDDLGGLTEQNQLAARRYLRFWTQDVSNYRKSLLRDVDEFMPVAEKLSKWLSDVGLFLHGYFLFRLCQNRSVRKAEQEIWMTQFRTLAVMRTTRTSEEENANKKKIRRGPDTR